MSGETAKDISGWSIDTLRAHLEGQIAALEVAAKERHVALTGMLQERYATQTKAVDAAFASQQLAMQTALTAAETAVAKALESAEKAVIKAEVAADKRFASVNEFRQQLNDQAATFYPRTEGEAALQRHTERLQELALALEKTVPRVDVDVQATTINRRLNELSAALQASVTRLELEAVALRYAERLDNLTNRINTAEGRGAGLNAGWLYLLAGVAAIGTIVSIYLALRGG